MPELSPVTPAHATLLHLEFKTHQELEEYMRSWDDFLVMKIGDQTICLTASMFLFELLPYLKEHYVTPKTND